MSKVKLAILLEDLTIVTFEEDQIQEAADYTQNLENYSLFKLEGVVNNKQVASIKPTKLWPK